MNIDWSSLALQTINVIVLLWLLWRLLYKPLRGVVAERRAAVTQTLDAAQAAKDKAEAERAALEQQRTALDASRAQVLADAHRQAEDERARVQQQAAQEADAQRQALQAALERERREAAAAIAGEASALAVTIAGRLLAQLPAPAVFDAFLDRACAELARLPEAQGFAAGDDVECVSAQPLTEADEARVRQRLGAALGAAPTLRFRTDASLLAGLELHLPHAQVRSHWARDLARVLDALKTDARAV